MKKSLEEQKHFIPPTRDKVPEGAKKTKKLFFATLCALASLREIVYFFTTSAAMIPRRRDCAPAGAMERPPETGRLCQLVCCNIQFLTMVTGYCQLSKVRSYATLASDSGP